MKKKAILIAAAAAALSLGISAKASADTDMYRLYNPNSGEHFYTATPNEKNNLVNAGWSYEGIGWVAPDSGEPVYRLYNPNAGDHFYTLSSFEKDSLVKAGWNYEGIGWRSGGSVPLYRAYNPNAVAGAHNYTTGSYEQSELIKAGWRDEGIAWQAVGTGQKTSSVSSMNLAQIQAGDYSSIKGTWKDPVHGYTLTITKTDITGYIPEDDYIQKVVVKNAKLENGYLIGEVNYGPIFVPKNVQVTGNPNWEDDTDSTRDRIIAGIGRGATADFNAMSKFAYYRVN